MTSAEPTQPAVALLAYPGFSEFQVTPALALLSSKYHLEVVGLNDYLVRSENGLRVLPTTTIDAVQVQDYAALIIPGGVDVTRLAFAPQRLPQLLAEFAGAGKVLGAICGAPFLLGLAGLLADRPYTVTFTQAQRANLHVLPESGFQYRDVVQSGNIITAQGHAFVAFGLALAEALGALDHPERARKYYTGQGNTGMEEDSSAP